MELHFPTCRGLPFDKGEQLNTLFMPKPDWDVETRHLVTEIPWGTQSSKCSESIPDKQSQDLADHIMVLQLPFSFQTQRRRWWLLYIIACLKEAWFSTPVVRALKWQMIWAFGPFCQIVFCVLHQKSNYNYSQCHQGSFFSSECLKLTSYSHVFCCCFFFLAKWILNSLLNSFSWRDSMCPQLNKPTAMRNSPEEEKGTELSCSGSWIARLLSTGWLHFFRNCVFKEKCEALLSSLKERHEVTDKLSREDSDLWLRRGWKHLPFASSGKSKGQDLRFTLSFRISCWISLGEHMLNVLISTEAVLDRSVRYLVLSIQCTESMLLDSTLGARQLKVREHNTQVLHWIQL